MNNKEHRTRWFHVAAHGLTALVMGYFITWVAVNITLGCETWDRTQWTETASCAPILFWDN